MFSNTKALLALVACALLTQAQSSAPTPDACIIGCATTGAAAAGCASYTDLPCVCTSTTFQTVAGGCIQANCTASDLATAQAIQQAECANVTTSSTSSAASTTGTKGTTIASSSTSSAASTKGTTTTSSSASSSSTSKSNAALALAAPFSFDTLVGTLIVSAGALVGGAFVL